tara:strand:- start:13 stop:255 length:243 start_codon:yes stop_codon:yes gene_type:complete
VGNRGERDWGGERFSGERRLRSKEVTRSGVKVRVRIWRCEVVDGDEKWNFTRILRWSHGVVITESNALNLKVKGGSSVPR